MVTPLRIDDGLGQDLCVFFRLGFRGKVGGVLLGGVYVAIDEGQQIVTVGTGGVPQVDNRNLVTIIFPGYGPVVSGQISLGIKSEKTHSAGTGKFEIGVQKEGRLAHTAGPDHETIDVIAVHQGGDLLPPANTVQDQPLLCREIFALPPLLNLERDMGIGLPDLLYCDTLHPHTAALPGQSG